MPTLLQPAALAQATRATALDVAGARCSDRPTRQDPLKASLCTHLRCASGPIRVWSSDAVRVVHPSQTHAVSVVGGCDRDASELKWGSGAVHMDILHLPARVVVTAAAASRRRTARNVLERLSGVNEPPMIIPMTTTGARSSATTTGFGISSAAPGT
jgi:hypothetical protein